MKEKSYLGVWQYGQDMPIDSKREKRVVGLEWTGQGAFVLKCVCSFSKQRLHYPAALL